MVSRLEQSNRGNRHRNEGIGRGNPATREAILDAAQRVLDQKNIVDATVDDVVREAVVARGTFYIYFKDKYDVLKALAVRENERLFDDSHLQVEPAMHPYDRLRASLGTVITHWQMHANLFRSMTQMALARADFREIDRRNRLRYIQKIRSDIEGSTARGHMHAIDPRVASKALAAMMDWFCLLWFGMNEPPYAEAGDPDQVSAVVDQLALIWYRALYASDPRP